MDYVSEMRAAVGARPLLLPAVALLGLREGRLLMQLRSDNGLWGIPGGYMEPGESPTETARREAREETGLEAPADSLELLGVEAGEGSRYVYPNGHVVDIVSIVYLWRLPDAEPRVNDHEGLELRFWPLDALPPRERLMPPNLPILDRFLGELRSRLERA